MFLSPPLKQGGGGRTMGPHGKHNSHGIIPASRQRKVLNLKRLVHNFLKEQTLNEEMVKTAIYIFQQ